MAMNMDAMLRIKADVQGENNIRRLGNSMQGLQGQVKNAAAGFSSLKGAVAGFGAAIAGSAIVGGLTAVVKKSIDAGDELFNLQAKTGVAANALIGIGNAAKLADVDMATLGKGLTKLNINLVRAAEGNEDLARKFAALGVEVKGADGQVVSSDKALKQIADRFADMPDGAQKAAAAVALFGKSGADLIPLLNEGAASMEKFTYKVSDDFAARSDLFNDTITELGIKTQGFGLELTDALLPALQSILEVFGDLFDTDQDWTALFKVIEGVIRGIAVAIYTVVKAVDILIKNVVASVQAAGQALSGDFGAAWNTITSRMSSGIAEAQQAIKDLNKLAFGSAVSPGTGRRTRGTNMGLDTTDADREREAAARRAAAEAKRAATEQERLEQRRDDLGRRALDLQQQLREQIEDVNNAYSGVGANEFEQLALRRNEAITENNRLIDELTRDVVTLAVEINKAGGQIDVAPFEKLINALSEANVLLADKEYQQGLKEIGDEAAQAAIGLLEFTDAVELQGFALAGVQGAISSYLDSIGTLKEGISSLTQSAFKGLEDAIVSLTTTGAFNFRAFALSIIEETTRMVTRLLIIAPILQFLQSLIPGGGALSGTNALSTTKLVPGGIFAKGGTFANGIQPFASGGIVNSPTLFKFANGGAMRNGLMGEAGPEAIIPLKRGRDGKLGVAGGGGTSVVVNVDAKGTSVQGNSGQGEQLGRAISQAVQAELIKQKRPGGLLAA
jgi:lambda family phage tail tape measure protein